MADYENTLEYLEKAIRAGAFGTRAGQEAVRKAASRQEDQTSAAMPFFKSFAEDDMKQQIKSSLETIAGCGAPSLEGRARHLLELLNAPAGRTRLSRITLAVSMVGFLAMFAGIFVIAFSGLPSMALGRFSRRFNIWDLIVGILIVSSSVILARVRGKWPLIAYIAIIALILIAIPTLGNFGYVARKRAFALPLCFFSPLVVAVLSAIIRFLPAKLIGFATIALGLVFSLGMFGLIDFDLFLKTNTGLRLLIGLGLVAIGLKTYLRSSMPALLFSQNLVRRKLIWIGALSLCIFLLAWSFVVKPMFAHIPLDGKWKGTGQGDLIDIAFTIENGVITGITPTLRHKQGSGVSYRHLSSDYKVANGEFSLDKGSTVIEGVFDNETSASGKVYVKETETEWEEPLGGIRSPRTLTREWEGQWTAQIETQDQPESSAKVIPNHEEKREQPQSATPQEVQKETPLPKIIRKSGGVLQGSATRRVEPAYPPSAKAARVGGAVTVEVTVDEEGSVISATVLSGHPMLKDAAVQAARGWKFTRTELSGVPVKVIGTITFIFNP